MCTCMVYVRIHMMCVGHGMHEAVKEQLIGVGSLLPLFESQG